MFATGSVHLKKNSIVVTAGDHVVQGQKIGEVASAASSTGPHLHYEVWGSGFYELVETWAGKCGPNYETPLWENGNSPWIDPEAPDNKFIIASLSILSNQQKGPPSL